MSDEQVQEKDEFPFLTTTAPSNGRKLRIRLPFDSIEDLVANIPPDKVTILVERSMRIAVQARIRQDMEAGLSDAEAEANGIAVAKGEYVGRKGGGGGALKPSTLIGKLVSIPKEERANAIAEAVAGFSEEEKAEFAAVLGELRAAAKGK